MSLPDEYRPDNIDDLIISDETKNILKSWIDSWLNHEETKKSVILWGTQGTGKTSTAYALSKYAGLSIIEMNASDQRNRENMKRIALMASEYHDLFISKEPDKLILVDEADNIFESKNPSKGGDSGGLSELLDIIRKTKNPIIITMNDYYAFRGKNSAKEIISSSIVIDMTPYKRKNELNYKLFFHRAFDRLKFISDRENINISGSEINKIIKENEPDMRSMINDLYLYKVANHDTTGNSRDTSRSIYYIISDTFRKNNYDYILNSLYSMDDDPDFYMKWIDENIPNEYSDPGDMMNSYDILSKADIYYGKRLRDYSLVNYALEISSGVSLVIKNKNDHYVKYEFPEYIKKLSARKNNRERYNLRNFMIKLSVISHTSVSEILNEMWFYYILKTKAKKDFNYISLVLNLSDDEKSIIKK